MKEKGVPGSEDLGEGRSAFEDVEQLWLVSGLRCGALGAVGRRAGAGWWVDLRAGVRLSFWNMKLEPI